MRKANKLSNTILILFIYLHLYQKYQIKTWMPTTKKQKATNLNLRGGHTKNNK